MFKSVNGIKIMIDTCRHKILFLVLSLIFIGSFVFATEEKLVKFLLSGFESEEEFSCWTGSEGVEIEWSEKFVTEGRHSLKATYPKYQEGVPQWPLVNSRFQAGGYPVKDWSEYGMIEADIYNPQNSSAPIALEIRDKEGVNGWFQRWTLPPLEWTTIKVNIEDIGKVVNISNVEKIIFYMSRPASATTFYIDRFCLIKKEFFLLLTNFKKLKNKKNWLESKKIIEEIDTLDKMLSKGEINLSQLPELEKRINLINKMVEDFLSKPTLAFDFGPAAQKIKEGFISVSKESLFLKEKGYGWKEEKEFKMFSYPLEREWKYSEYYRHDIPPDMYLNEITQDGLFSDTPAEFLVNLTPDKYWIYFLSGASAQIPPTVFDFYCQVNDVKVKVKIPQPKIFEYRLFPVVVKDSPLKIAFFPETAWILNSLIVIPDKEIEKFTQGFLPFFHQEIYVLPEDILSKMEEVVPLPEPVKYNPNDLEKEKGYILFSRPCVDNVYKNSYPKKEEIRNDLSMFATPGEYEPLTFSIYPLKNFDDIKIDITDLKTLKGAISKENIQIYSVRYWFVRTSYANFSTYKNVPELLDTPCENKLKNGVPQTYWFNIYVPENVPSGIYQGEIIISIGEKKERLNLSLEVLPFTLKKNPEYLFSNYYRDPARDYISEKNGEKANNEILKRKEKEMEDWRVHGMNAMLIVGYIQYKKVEGRYLIQTKGLKEQIEFYQKQGLLGAGQPISLNIEGMMNSIYKEFTGKSWAKHGEGASMPAEAYFEIVTDIISQIEEERNKNSWPKIYYYPLDEASSSIYPFFTKILEAIKKVPGAGTYVTQYLSPLLSPYVDVWCSGNFAAAYGDEEIQKIKVQGQKFWCYPNFIACSHGVPNAARMTYGFGFWRSGFEALLPWHYQAPNGNPFNDLDSRYGDWCYTYPGPEGPIFTTTWEAVREGIDDGRYIYTLQSICDEARKKGKEGLAKGGEELLKQIWKEIPAKNEYFNPTEWDGNKFQENRRKIANKIIEIRNSL